MTHARGWIPALFVVVLAACGSSGSPVRMTPTPTATITPTATAPPTSTPTITPSLGGCVAPFPAMQHCAFNSQLYSACLDPDGGTECFPVVAPADCCWSIGSFGSDCYAGDIVITQGSRGCGDGTVCFTYQSNPCRSTRGLYIEVGDKDFFAAQIYNTPPPTPKPSGPTPTWTPSPTPTPTLGLTLTLTEFPLATASAFPNSITSGPDGNLWFTESAANKIGRISPQSPHTITEFPLATTNAGPFDIVAGPDGNLWFTEYLVSRIGRISPQTPDAISEFSTGYGVPFGITTGPDGALWYTEAVYFTQTSGIGRIPADNPSLISDVVLPSVPLDATFAITAGPDDNVWFIEADQIGQAMPRNFPSGIRLSVIATRGFAQRGHYGITGGPDGNVWFANANDNKIVRATLPATGTTTSPHRARRKRR